MPRASARGMELGFALASPWVYGRSEYAEFPEATINSL
jgi:hypothetical protein